MLCGGRILRTATTITAVATTAAAVPPHSLHLFLESQVRCSSQSQFSVIDVPVSLQRKMKREKLKEKKKERERIREHSRMGNTDVTIIRCRRGEFDHHLGQCYSRFGEVPLASKGWYHRKAAGDYFTINTHGPNPAFGRDDSESVEDFASLGVHDDIVSQLDNMAIKTPTNIQSIAIPHVLAGKNTLITAETGNGKTLAFLCPMLQQILERRATTAERPFNSPVGLVIVPSKELAKQIHEVASQVAVGLGIKVGLLIGGGTKRRMLNPPMNHQDLLVASFGALSKLTTVGIYNTNYLTHITLDEADTLLDDSFNDDLTRFMRKQPIQGVSGDEDQLPEVLSGAQLTLVAATTPRDTAKILRDIVDLDSLVNVSTPHLNRCMPHVCQRFLRVNNRTKPSTLVDLAKKDAKKDTPLIIFSNTSKTSDWVSMFLNENGVSCVNLNSTMAARRRQQHYNAFRSGEVKVLSCTDLTSRGLDTCEVPHVINYEFPTYIADYIHRCGRTGRVGSGGSSLVTNLIQWPWEVELVHKLEYAVRKGEEFHNVNANIKRIISAKLQKREMNMETT